MIRNSDLKKYLGLNLTAITIRQDSGSAGGDCEILELEFEGGHSLELRTQDSSGYQSWLEES